MGVCDLQGFAIYCYTENIKNEHVHSFQSTTIEHGTIEHGTRNTPQGNNLWPKQKLRPAESWVAASVSIGGPADLENAHIERPATIGYCVDCAHAWLVLFREPTWEVWRAVLCMLCWFLGLWGSWQMVLHDIYNSHLVVGVLHSLAAPLENHPNNVIVMNSNSWNHHLPKKTHLKSVLWSVVWERLAINCDWIEESSIGGATINKCNYLWAGLW